MKKNNFLVIDLLRGFAALAVLCYHLELGQMFASTLKIPYFKIIDIVGSSLAVPLFFLISGFCIHLSQINQNIKTESNHLDLRQYFVRRFWRIYPPYIIILFFSMAIFAIVKQPISIIDFLIHLFVLQGVTIQFFNSINLVLWTITIEILFYALYPIWYYIRFKTNLNKAFGIAILVSVLSWIVGSIFKINYQLPGRWFVLNIWAGWVFGAWLAEKSTLENKLLVNKKWWWIAGFITLVLLYFLRQFFKLNNDFYNTYLVSIIDTLNVVMWAWPVAALIYIENNTAVFNQRYLKIPINFFQKIGIASYSLYIIHMPIITLFNNLTTKRSPLILSFMCVGILIISWFTYQLFEKPFLKYRLK